MTFSERILVHRASGGNRVAFAVLYDRNAPRVYNLLRRLTASDSEAEDLTQETFLTAWQKLDEWQGRGQFGTWLCGIAVRHAQNRNRHLARRETEPMDAETAASHVLSDPFLHLSNRELAAELEQALRNLPTVCREVFVLIKVEGWTQRETAECLEIPIGTVQSRLHRAIQRLRIALSETVASPQEVSTSEEEPAHVLPHRA